MTRNPEYSPKHFSELKCPVSIREAAFHPGHGGHSIGRSSRRRAGKLHRPLQGCCLSPGQRLCSWLFKLSHLGVNSGLQKSCKDSSGSSHIPFAASPAGNIFNHWATFAESQKSPSPLGHLCLAEHRRRVDFRGFPHGPFSDLEHPLPPALRLRFS